MARYMTGIAYFLSMILCPRPLIACSASTIKTLYERFMKNQHLLKLVPKPVVAEEVGYAFFRSPCLLPLIQLRRVYTQSPSRTFIYVPAEEVNRRLGKIISQVLQMRQA